MSIESCKEKVDSKKSRLVPGNTLYILLLLGTGREQDYPIYILSDEFEKVETDEMNFCEMLIQSRKIKFQIENTDLDPSILFSLNDTINPNCWNLVVFKYFLFIVFTFREILRDCQLLLKTVEADQCALRCPCMSASEGIEYLCACHPKTKKCSAIDYYYHNINYSVIRLAALNSYVES